MLFLDAITPATLTLLKRLQSLLELAATRLVGGEAKDRIRAAVRQLAQ